MIWLIATISSYLILALVFLVDKYLISGAILSPKLYAFYVGMLGVLALVLAPFINFYIPDYWQIFLSFLAGLSFVYALFWFYKLLSLFETSRAVPAIGGFLPIFSFLLVFLTSWGKETLQFREFSAFISLILGTILITYKKKAFEKREINLKLLSFSAVAALLWALHFVLAKYVYLGQGFLNGFLWIRIGGGVSAFSFFLLSKELRRDVFKLRRLEGAPLLGSSKTAGIFISNQLLGVTAHILQNWAISLVPIIYISLITALQGVQYLFLLIFGAIISLKFPQILKEEVSAKIIFQKMIAILFIGGGLVLLAFQ